MASDFATELDLIGRLLLAAVLGAVIGVEREIHDHPAGIRTHLLVALGSALFTVLSIVGFPSADGSATDPSRVAAQIVTGIGFLGAGAILKYGPSVRGLTTAASLWAAAGIGMAAGAGWPVLGIATTVIVLLSLWPLRLLSERLELVAQRRMRVRILLREPARLAELFDWFAGRQLEIVHLDSEHEGGGQAIDLVLGLPVGTDRTRIRAELGGLDWISLGAGDRPE